MARKDIVNDPEPPRARGEGGIIDLVLLFTMKK